MFVCLRRRIYTESTRFMFLVYEKTWQAEKEIRKSHSIYAKINIQ